MANPNDLATQFVTHYYTLFDQKERRQELLNLYV